MDKKIIDFTVALNSWGTDLFSSTLIKEIMSLKTGVLPLQQGLSQGDMASEQPTKVTLISSDETETEVIAKLAVFFTEIISGCSCGDDPAVINGYCEMRLTMNKHSGQADFKVIA